MIVQHNITSMNANRQLGIVGNNLAKSTEKLSSGYRINRAADDAAGLAISEKMRAQVRGLNRASDNAQDGISLIQTAEGAMDQQHAILQRARELVVQAGNTGVLDDGTTSGSGDDDFRKIQDELDELEKEFTRINDQTEFNKKKLLDGSYKDQYLQLGANNAQGIDVTIKTTAWDPDLYLSKTTEVAKNTVGTASDKNAGTNGTVVEGTTQYEYNSKIFTVEESYVAAKGNKKEITAADKKTVADDGKTTYADSSDAVKALLTKYGYAATDDGLKNMKDDYAADANKKTSVTDVDGEAISGLLDNVDSMIKSVTTERSKLGAVQNRLEYTVKVDDNTSENLQSAESRIRDTDMADEMTRFSKESILQQAATSMLAQANQANQGVLSLLQ